MRGHKFVCMVDPTYWLRGDMPDSTEKQIAWSDESYMTVLTFPFPDFTDNLVDLKAIDGEVYSFARDMNGRLYYVSDWLSKVDIINKFEQTEE